MKDLQKPPIYTTQGIYYPPTSQGYGITHVFYGDMANWINWCPKVFYQAKIDDDCQDRKLSRDAPCWQVTARVFMDDGVREVKEENVKVIKNISEEHAVQFLHFLQDEAVRIRAYYSLVFSGEVSPGDELSELLVFPHGEDPKTSSEYHLLARSSDRQDEFPFYLTTLEFLMNKEVFEEIERQILEEGLDPDDWELEKVDVAEEPKNRTATDDDLLEIEDGVEHVLTYSTMDNVNRMELAAKLDPRNLMEISGKLQEVRCPRSFKACYAPKVDITFEGIKFAASWTIRSQEEGNRYIDIMECGTLRETCDALALLQETAIDKTQNIDPYHARLAKYYNDHFTNWSNEQIQAIDDYHAKNDCRL